MLTMLFIEECGYLRLRMVTVLVSLGLPDDQQILTHVGNDVGFFKKSLRTLSRDATQWLYLYPLRDFGDMLFAIIC